MKKLSQCLVWFFPLTLLGCATPQWSYKESGGCGIRFNQTYVERNIASMNWDGECKSGLASGNGTLVMSLKNGKTERYVGQMNEGTLSGQGSYTDQGGYTRTGQFSYGALYYGKRFNPDNALVFEGGFYASGNYKMGKVYYPDGGYVDGGFIDKASAINRTTGQGIEHGVVKNANGVEIDWFLNGNHLKSGAEYHTALMNYLDAKTQAAQKQMAKMEAENARLMVEQKAKNDRETAAAWAQVANTTATTLKKGTAAQIAFEALANNGDGSQVQPSSARTSASSRAALPNDANDSAKTMNENTCVYPTLKCTSVRVPTEYTNSSEVHQVINQCGKKISITQQTDGEYSISNTHHAKAGGRLNIRAGNKYVVCDGSLFPNRMGTACCP